MLRMFLAILLTGSTTSTALAGDDDMMSNAPQWSGLFLGVQAGRGVGSSYQDLVSPKSNDILIDVDGAFVGGSAEYLWQNGDFVFGPQAEIAWSSIDGNFSLSVSNHFSSDVDWFGSVGGKTGWAFDNVLVFGTAGFAFADISAGQSNSILSKSYAESQLNTGYSLGAGLDVMLQDGWVLGAEYRYYDYAPAEYFTGSSNGFQHRVQDTEFQTISIRLRKKLN